MSDSQQSPNYIELATDIVSAYVSNNTVNMADLPSLIKDVYQALANVNTVAAPEAVAMSADPVKPAVNPKKSIQPDYLICLEDGMKFKSLKRHLRTKYGLSPEDYKEKWGLPADYPMVAPAYAEARSKLAKEMGLGNQRGSRRSSV